MHHQPPSDDMDIPTMLRAQSIRMEAIDRRLETGDEKMHDLERSMKDNTAATEQIARTQDRFGTALMENIRSTKSIETSTKELIEILHSWRGAMRVLETVSKVIKPIGYIAAAFASVWGFVSVLKGGGR